MPRPVTPSGYTSGAEVRASCDSLLCRQVVQKRIGPEIIIAARRRIPVHFWHYKAIQLVAFERERQMKRGCRTIVVLDGGCDRDLIYDDLGNALRKIRIDLGITIDFGQTMPLQDKGKRCALADIRYRDGEPGTLLYVKPLILGDEPPDVAAYKAANQDFPHQSTGDQWFDESQFESYRMHGAYTMEKLCPGGAVDFRDFVRKILRDHLHIPESQWPAEFLEPHT